MPKKKIEQTQREMTKRQLSHHQRQSRIQRYTLLGGIIVIVAVIVLVTTGFFVNKVAPYRAIVLKAGDTEYNLSYYTDTLDFYVKAQYPSYQQMYQQYFNQQLSVDSYLNMISVYVPQYIQQNQFLKESAAKLDPPITVSDDEVTKEIKDKGYPSNEASRDAVYAQLLNTKLNDYFDKQVPESAEQRAVWAMFLESLKQVQQVKDEIAGGKTFNDLAGQLSLEAQTKSKNGDLLWVPQGVLPTIIGNSSNKTLDDLVFNPNTVQGELTQAEDTVQSKSIGYWLLKVTEVQASTPTATPTDTPDSSATPTATTTGKAHVLAMLLGSQDQADQIKAQLENGGDFATLAKANSLESSVSTNSGDFGMLSKEEISSQISQTAADAIFPEDASKALTVGVVSSPIADIGQTTTGGYWLVDVTGIEVKKIEGDNRTILVNDKMQAWENQVWTDNKDKAQNLLTAEQTSIAVTEAAERNS